MINNGKYVVMPMAELSYLLQSMFWSKKQLQYKSCQQNGSKRHEKLLILFHLHYCSNSSTWFAQQIARVAQTQTQLTTNINTLVPMISPKLLGKSILPIYTTTHKWCHYSPFATKYYLTVINGLRFLYVG